LPVFAYFLPIVFYGFPLKQGHSCFFERDNIRLACGELHFSYSGLRAKHYNSMTYYVYGMFFLR